MADLVVTGFGSSPAVRLQGSANEVIARYIPSQPQRKIAIRIIRIQALQITGVFTAVNYIPVSVVRIPPSSQNLQGALKAPFRSTATLAGLQVPGLPTQSDIGPFELLYQDLIRTQDPSTPIEVPVNGLYAQDGAQLCVVISSVLDGTTAAPALTDNFAIVHSVLGDDVFWNSGQELAQVPGGVGRSIPRFDMRNE